MDRLEDSDIDGIDALSVGSVELLQDVGDLLNILAGLLIGYGLVEVEDFADRVEDRHKLGQAGVRQVALDDHPDLHV
jgi:uncharacterized metal-binding protein